MSILTAKRDRPIGGDFVESPDESSWTTDTLDYAALVVVGALVALIVGNAPAPIREVMVLAFMSYVPGRALATHCAWLKGAPLALITVVGSLAFTALLATVTVWMHLWSPMVLLAVMTLGSVASLVLGLANRHEHDAGSSGNGGTRRLAAESKQLSPRLAFRTTRSGRHHSATASAAASWWHLRISDAVLPVSVLLFAWGLSNARVGRIDRWGLLPALPAYFYVGFGLLIASIVRLLSSRQLSSPRLAAHLTTLVVMIAGTPALVYPVPRYTWLYKHVGVVQYINLHGSVDQSIDIYHNWPGFFALFAWFDRVASASSPIRFAAWSESVVMLISCLAIYTAARQLRMTARERWIGLFIFVLASWVDQLYFSPQAFAYALSLTVLALILSWNRYDTPAHWVAWAQTQARRLPRRARTSNEASDEDGSVSSVAGAQFRPGIAAMVLVLGIYGVLVFVHQLSPYVVALQVTVLALFGYVRPKWLAPVLWVVAIAYLVPRFDYINKAYGIVNSLGNFFSNTQTNATAVHRPYDLGVRIAAYAADAITVVVWSTALVGIFRRVRAGRPTMVLCILAFSPLITFFLTNYGGEAEYRVYFFSLPWVALLAASAFGPWTTERRIWRPALALATVVGALGFLIFPAYVGDDEIYAVPASEIAAANYFYTHAPEGAALILAAPSFPGRVSGRYDKYLTLKNEVDPNLLNYPQFANYQPLGTQTLPALSDFALGFANGGRTSVYIAFAASELTAATAYNLAPPGALLDLRTAMSESPQWSVYFKNDTTTIFEFHAHGLGR